MTSPASALTAAAPAAARYAVFGNPVEHSRSPFIHGCFAAQTGESIEYDRILAPLGGFADSVRAFIAAGGRGLNVTVPFKLEAHALADTLSARARAAGAVNTLRVDADGLYGDNTDGFGLVRDITHNLGVALGGRRVLLLGAGGAARGVVLPLIEHGVTALTIVNRTSAKASALVERFARAARAAHCELRGGSGNQAHGAFAVIINATAGSLDAALPEFDTRAFGADTLAYDMMYGARPTVFMQHALACGARTADGLGMLVEQAAEAFFVWRGVRPDSAPVLAALRNALHSSPGDS